MCQNEVVADPNRGGRPWIRLFDLVWIRPRMFFSYSVGAAEHVVVRRKLRRKEMV